MDVIVRPFFFSPGKAINFSKNDTSKFPALFLRDLPGFFFFGAGKEKRIRPAFQWQGSYRLGKRELRTFDLVGERGWLFALHGQADREIRTERMYQNFVMELEWRHLKPRGNAGVFVWADDITARGQPFHRGVEVQVLENAYGNTKSFTTHGDIFPIHGARMKPINGRGGSRAFPTENRSNPSPEWNHYRIECNDGNISLAVNGKIVTRGTECWPKKGYICLESEGGQVDYRNVKIKELPDTPIKPEEVAIANRGYRCLYTGVDLSAGNHRAIIGNPEIGISFLKGKAKQSKL